MEFRRLVSVAALGLLCSPLFAADLPPIQGKPQIDAPQLLMWPYDAGDKDPNLNDPTSNVLFDFHGEINDCDFVLSSEGNYHPALHDIWPRFLAKFKDRPLKNAWYSTSPPQFLKQIPNGGLQFGNLYNTCRPQVAVAGMEQIKKLQQAGLADGEPLALYEDRGEAILVKKGNPKNIKTVWDLARADVHYVSPNPEREAGAFKSYAETLYGIASKDAQAPADMNADRLVNAIFNSNTPGKWLAGPHIHHRDVPWSIAYGKGDAALIIYHLARYIKQTFPNQFDIVALGGTVDNPQPLPGTKTTVRYIVKVKGDWSARQREATQVFVDTLMSSEFTQILQQRGLQRPTQPAAK